MSCIIFQGTIKQLSPWQQFHLQKNQFASEGSYVGLQHLSVFAWIINLLFWAGVIKAKIIILICSNIKENLSLLQVPKSALERSSLNNFTLEVKILASLWFQSLKRQIEFDPSWSLAKFKEISRAKKRQHQLFCIVTKSVPVPSPIRMLKREWWWSIN